MSLRANRIRVRTSKLMRSWHCARHARIGIATQTPRSLSKKKIVAEARTAKIKEMDLSYIRSMVLNRHFMYRNKYQGNTERAEREYLLLIHPNLTCIDERNNMPILWYISYMLRIEFKVPRWGQQNRISAFPYLWSVEMKRMQYSTCLRCSNMVKNPAERDREKTVGNHLINDRVELWVYNSNPPPFHVNVMMNSAITLFYNRWIGKRWLRYMYGAVAKHCSRILYHGTIYEHCSDLSQPLFLI